MTTEPPSLLPDILNRVEAIIECGAGTVRELATFLLPEQDPKQSGVRVSEWIKSRIRTPNGETALRMREWAAVKTLEITKHRKATKYNQAYRAIERKRATTASKS